jgi:hypothetical protein
MADFCKKCTEDMFGPEAAEQNDLAGLTSHESWDKGLAVSTICEGCGPIQVDPHGNCASNCMLGDLPGHNVAWKVVAQPTCQPDASVAGVQHLSYSLRFVGKVNVEGKNIEAAKAALEDHLAGFANQHTAEGSGGPMDASGAVFVGFEMTVEAKGGDACESV